MNEVKSIVAVVEFIILILRVIYGNGVSKILAINFRVNTGYVVKY